MWISPTGNLYTKVEIYPPNEKCIRQIFISQIFISQMFISQIFIRQMGHLYAKFVYAKFVYVKWDIYTPNFYTSHMPPSNDSNGYLIGSNGYFEPCLCALFWTQRCYGTYIYTPNVTFISQIFIRQICIRQMGHLYAKYLSAKYLSAKYLYAKYLYAKWDIYTPIGNFIRQVGIFIRQTLGWLGCKAWCELAKHYLTNMPTGALILSPKCLYKTNPRNLLSNIRVA